MAEPNSVGRPNTQFPFSLTELEKMRSNLGSPIISSPPPQSLRPPVIIPEGSHQHSSIPDPTAFPNEDKSKGRKPQFVWTEQRDLIFLRQVPCFSHT